MVVWKRDIVRAERRNAATMTGKGGYTMPKLIFIIGATATGKTHFIDQQYGGKDFVRFNIYDYQQQVYAKTGFVVPFGAQFRCLMQANNLLLTDMKEKLLQGKNVVVEHTLFMAKRRIAYIDEIRKAVKDVTIEVYVMRPSDGQWAANIESRGLEGGLKSFQDQARVMEFPNPAEGIDAIYEVVDGRISLRMEPPRPEIFEAAKQALAEEAARLGDEDEKTSKRKALIASMNERPFWHYCEVCGKKAFITAQEAWTSGWDYPPKLGRFGLLGARTCGSCPLTGSLYWKIHTSGGLPVVCEGNLTPEELVTWRRIKGEPESLLEEET